MSQVYVPDPAAVGQYMADVAAAMARRGWRVVVLTSARGYDDPARRYPRRELKDGVEIHRLPLSSFGKSSIAVRLLAQCLFLLQVFVRAVFVRGVRRVLVTTSPPMAAAVGCAIGLVRGAPVTWWVMDLNPDQMVALGKTSARGRATRAFDALNRFALRHARDVVVLDRFMADRVNRKLDVSTKLAVVPPWPLDDRLGGRLPDRSSFRREHGLEGKLVVMYSGNHSPANPLTTLLAAARRLCTDPRFVFAFIGAGQGKEEVERAMAAGCTNVVSLPYQPLEEIGRSLSAADVQVAAIGDELVGIVHPSKIYGAMAVGRPLLTFGPPRCHLAELVRRFGIGFHVAHGDVDAATAALQALAAAPREERAAMGARASRAVAGELRQSAVRAQFCTVVEVGARLAQGGPRSARAAAVRPAQQPLAAAPPRVGLRSAGEGAPAS